MAMELSSVTTIALISLLGAMSPGPDFAIVTKNCLSGSFRTGFLTSLGVASALLIHVTYCVLGVALLISESPLFFHLLKYLGALYLFYLGIMLLREKMSSPEGEKSKLKSTHRAFVSGFLTNILNPKATLFILSLFTQFINPEMPLLDKAILGLTIAVIGFIWFVFLSYFLTHRLLQKHIKRFQFIITKTMGVALCLLAIYVAVSSR